MLYGFFNFYCKTIVKQILSFNPFIDELFALSLIFNLSRSLKDFSMVLNFSHSNSFIVYNAIEASFLLISHQYTL